MISVYYEITVGLCIKSYQLCLGDIEGLEDKLGIEIGHHVKVKDKKIPRIKKINMVQCGDIKKFSK